MVRRRWRMFISLPLQDLAIHAADSTRDCSLDPKTKTFRSNIQTLRLFGLGIQGQSDTSPFEPA
jgi:hypothetical protein